MENLFQANTQLNRSNLIQKLREFKLRMVLNITLLKKMIIFCQIRNKKLHEKGQTN